MRPPAMSRSLSAALFAVAAQTSSAGAIEPGDYVCAIESADLMTGGALTPFAGAPAEFTMTARDAPVSPDRLRRPPRTLDYYPEGEPAHPVSMRIDERLFATPLTNLQSTDGAVYTQDGNVFRFVEGGRFLAYGYAAFNDGSAGVAVYSGACTKM